MSEAPFDLAALEAALASTPFARHVHHLATTPSTQTLALEAARAGLRYGVWIADEQTAGRGRGTHTWHSAPGAGLYMTALVSPAIPIQSVVHLSFLTAIAVQSAIAVTAGVRIRDEIDIRWPNDLILHGRKVGGILIETAVSPAPAFGPPLLRHAIVGIGVNVNHTEFPPELEPIATSLRRESAQPTLPIAREPLAAAILLALHAELEHLTAHRAPRPSYLPFSSWLHGKRVRVEAPNRDQPNLPGYTGTTAGLNPDGSLLVRTDDGQLHTVLSGGLREP